MSARLRNPVFFVGCGRSGTTLLARILATHPEIAVYPYEANELWHPKTFPWTRSKVVVPPIWADARTYTTISLEHRDLRDDGRLAGAFGAYQLFSGGKRFVNKSVLITFMLDYVLRLFPEARFIHLVRDGRAVALSFARKEHGKMDRAPQRFEEQGYLLSMDELVEAFALHWKEHIDEIEHQKDRLSLAAAGRIHELRYEDLCVEPARELDALAAFIGVDRQGFSPRAYEQVEDRNYKFRSDLSAEVRTSLVALLAPTLALKGYPTDEHETYGPPWAA